MIKLVALPESALVYVLLQRLEEMGIDATLTVESPAATLYVGGARTALVWIPEASDEAEARRVLEEVQTRTSRGHCIGCGYDLRGHHGATACPECGRRAYAPRAAVVCPGCGETVPGSFDVCWSCGAVLVEP